jgi:prepilin-type N-terminal cleavage/methylation domain-containing protein
MKKIHLKNKYEKGFTLMEVMVSVTIFTIIVTIGMGALITIFKTLQKTRADRQTIDSISFVMDTMTRRIRTGKEYTSSDAGGGIKFIDQENVSVSFYKDSDSEGNSRIYMIDGAFGNQNDPVDITPENFTVKDFELTIIGTDPSDGIQPMVAINLKGVVRNGQQESQLAVQTIVSQRLLDFPAITGDLTGSGTGGATSGVVKSGSSTGPDGRILRTPRIESVATDGSSSSSSADTTTTNPDSTTTTSTLKALNPPR